MGPLAWRQILIAVRTPRYALIVSLGIAVVLGVLAFVVDRKSNGPALVSSMSVGFMGYMTFIIAMQLPWAFRGDIVHMDCLKSLPVSPLSVAIGELTGGVTLLSAIQFVPLVAVLLAGGSPAVLVSAIAFVIPFNLLILAMCNTVFLIYPIRFPQGNSADFQMVGRMMLMMFLQILLLIPALGVPAAVGGLAYVLSGFYIPVFVVVAWVALVAELPLWLFLLASMFDRFDPGTEMPA